MQARRCCQTTCRIYTNQYRMERKKTWRVAIPWVKMVLNISQGSVATRHNVFAYALRELWNRKLTFFGPAVTVFFAILCLKKQSLFFLRAAKHVLHQSRIVTAWRGWLSDVSLFGIKQLKSLSQLQRHVSNRRFV